MKICGCCGASKDESNFPVNKKGKNNRDSTCKICAAEKCRLWRQRRAGYVKLKRVEKYQKNRIALGNRQKAFYLANKEKISAQSKKYHAANKERRNQQSREYNKRTIEQRRIQRQRHYTENREEILRKNKEKWRKNHPRKEKPVLDHATQVRRGKAAAYRRKRLEIPEVKVHAALSKSLRYSLTRVTFRKTAKFFTYVSYGRDDLVAHLERQFTKGMTWDNYGQWHIDHIRPVSSFDLSDREQIMAAYDLPNLRPLWAEENWSKHARPFFLL